MDVQTLAVAAAPNYSGDATGNAVGSIPVPPSSGASADPTQKSKTLSDVSAAHQSLELPQEVARIFSGGASSSITVSFTVAHNPNEIVTVFKDRQSGEIISQVPSEIMVQMAEFFEHVAGVVLDKRA